MHTRNQNNLEEITAMENPPISSSHQRSAVEEQRAIDAMHTLLTRELATREHQQLLDAASLQSHFTSALPEGGRHFPSVKQELVYHHNHQSSTKRGDGYPTFTGLNNNTAKHDSYNNPNISALNKDAYPNISALSKETYPNITALSNREASGAGANNIPHTQSMNHIEEQTSFYSTKKEAMYNDVTASSKQEPSLFSPRQQYNSHSYQEYRRDGSPTENDQNHLLSSFQQNREPPGESNTYFHGGQNYSNNNAKDSKNLGSYSNSADSSVMRTSSYSPPVAAPTSSSFSAPVVVTSTPNDNDTSSEPANVVTIKREEEDSNLESQQQESVVEQTDWPIIEKSNILFWFYL